MKIKLFALGLKNNGGFHVHYQATHTENGSIPAHRPDCCVSSRAAAELQVAGPCARSSSAWHGLCHAMRGKITHRGDTTPSTGRTRATNERKGPYAHSCVLANSVTRYASLACCSARMAEPSNRASLLKSCKVGDHRPQPLSRSQHRFIYNTKHHSHLFWGSRARAPLPEQSRARDERTPAC